MNDECGGFLRKQSRGHRAEGWAVWVRVGREDGWDEEQVRILALRLPQFRHSVRWGSVDQPGVAALSAGSSVKSVGLPCQCDLFGSSQQQNQPPPLSNGADASE